MYLMEPPCCKMDKQASNLDLLEAKVGNIECIKYLRKEGHQWDEDLYQNHWEHISQYL